MSVLVLTIVAFCNAAGAIQKSADQSNLNSLVGLDDAIVSVKEETTISRQKLSADHLHRPTPMAAPAKANSFADLDEQSALETKLAAVKQRTCSEHKVCDHPEVPEEDAQARFLLSTADLAIRTRDDDGSRSAGFCAYLLVPNLWREPPILLDLP